MSTQALNCLQLFRGQQPEKILEALGLLKQTVVIELMDYCHASSLEDLSYKLFLNVQ